jgi:hypothetical protein
VQTWCFRGGQGIPEIRSRSQGVSIYICVSSIFNTTLLHTYTTITSATQRLPKQEPPPRSTTATNPEMAPTRQQTLSMTRARLKHFISNNIFTVKLYNTYTFLTYTKKILFINTMTHRYIHLHKYLYICTQKHNYTIKQT